MTSPIEAAAPFPTSDAPAVSELTRHMLAHAAFLLSRGTGLTLADRPDHSTTAGIYSAAAAYALDALHQENPETARRVTAELVSMLLDGGDLNEMVVGGLDNSGIDAEALFAAGRASIQEGGDRRG